MILNISSPKWFLFIYTITSIIIISKAASSCNFSHGYNDIIVTCKYEINIEMNDVYINTTNKYFAINIINEPSETVDSNTFKNLKSYNGIQENTRLMTAANNSWTTLKSLAFIDFKYCLNLDLYGNNIKIIENDTFLGMNLMNLNLSHNGIEVLYPRSLYTVSHSRIFLLNLSYNRLSYVSYDMFSQLEHLRFLHLEGNNIKYLEANCFDKMQNLVYLNLNSNRLTSLNESLHSLIFLATLDLSSNDFSEITGSDIKNLLYLQTINISNNTFERIDLSCFQMNKIEGINRYVCNSFTYFSFLGSLYLTSNRLPLPEIYGLYRFNNLRFLNVSNNIIGDEHFSTYLALTSLETLEISNCKLKDNKIVLNHGNLTTLITDYNTIVNISIDKLKLQFLSIKNLGLRGAPSCCDTIKDKMYEINEKGINLTFVDLPDNKCKNVCEANIPELNTTDNYIDTIITERTTDIDVLDILTTIEDIYEYTSSTNPVNEEITDVYSTTSMVASTENTSRISRPNNVSTSAETSGFFISSSNTTDTLTSTELNSITEDVDIDTSWTVTLMMINTTTDRPMYESSDDDNYLIWIILLCFLLLVMVLFIGICFRRYKRQKCYDVAVNSIKLSELRCREVEYNVNDII